MLKRRSLIRGLLSFCLCVQTYRAFPASSFVTKRWPSHESAGSISAQSAELRALMSEPVVDLIIEPGFHLIDGPIVCSAESIRLQGDPGGAAIVFNDLDRGGLRFVGARDCSVRDLSLFWDSNVFPKRSHYGAGLLFVRCGNVRVDNIEVSYAPGAGVHFDECNGPRVSNVIVTHSGADGVHFANCSNLVVHDVKCIDTGDDGIAVVDFLHKPESSGFDIRKCHIENSRARGFALIGASNGFFSDFVIINTSSNGIHIEQDAHYKTRFPVDISGVRVSVSGCGSVSPKKGNQYGVNILRSNRIELKDVYVDGGTSAGFSIVDSSSIAIKSSRVRGTRGENLRILRSEIDQFVAEAVNTRRVMLRATSCGRLNGVYVHFSIEGYDQLMDAGSSQSRSEPLVILDRNLSGDVKLVGVSEEDVVRVGSGVSVIVK